MARPEIVALRTYIRHNSGPRTVKACAFYSFKKTGFFFTDSAVALPEYVAFPLWRRRESIAHHGRCFLTATDKSATPEAVSHRVEKKEGVPLEHTRPNVARHGTSVMVVFHVSAPTLMKYEQKLRRGYSDHYTPVENHVIGSVYP
jgi:hypothetical protein